jgi:transcription antitermination factor NusG
MPLLAPEPQLFPEDLFQASESDQGTDRRWYVMYTRSRQEKSLARELRHNGISFYLPLVARRHRFGNRRMTAYVPLFPCYLPVYADREQWTAAYRTARIVRPLEVPDQEGFWRDLRQIERLLTSQVPVTPEGRLVVGAKVVIRSGALAGLEGVIVRSASGSRFVVQVDFMQRGASVLVEHLDLAPCH